LAIEKQQKSKKKTGLQHSPLTAISWLAYIVFDSRESERQ
jgi:hypothetical protein